MHSATKNIKAYLVLIDQNEALDKVDREFLYKIMHIFKNIY